MTAEVAVVGGGLAGIATALRCADAGRPVTLFEARPHLGGLTHSFTRGELHVDNGQHVFLRCCTAYLALLDRLGVADRVTLQPRLEIPIRTPGSTESTWLRRGDLPAPLHLAASLLRYDPLRPLDRARFALAALALRRVDPTDDRTDRQSFGEWLRRHGQSAAAIEALWDLVGVATLNATADEASLSLAATVFQEGLLTDPAAADIGWSLVPLRELHGDAALEALTTAGADVRTGTKVRAIEETAGGWRVRTDDGEATFGQVVLAAPPPVTEKLAPPGAIPLPHGWSGGLGSSPIVNVHVVLDRRVLDEPFVAGVRTPVQWVFDRTRQSGLASGQYLAMSLSAADDLIDLPTATLRERLLPELTGLLPEARGAQVLDFFVTRERHATFRPGPGTASLRPAAETSARGLYLAGAWTATGWPATMEGAARSGAAAATALLEKNVHEEKEGVGA
ncbi:hydroxysqualene dehydroxylase HpnE [Amycolatopsis carbonis]|uniref:Hydroxysqualene dehydroxylase HpnE n=1 Tax=Amycolatopsis carbonis TaxID=715471 RepID=A0A9Y2MU90_9PSEU|nr:hydroxysqualene dehydroxylase HpnE [Amycolatopsis sp. 2-15]WIX77603.1 hydroxysqualene dehydroxylase HpnE [Amycolatopsis sp. 2-15]